MTRRPIFWILFSVVGIGGALIALRLFPVAFPLVTLDIAMDRQAAMAEAKALAERYGWEPLEARSAASFGQRDPEVQTFVELEGGGRDAFVDLFERGVYQPYVWTVRRFQEDVIEEARVRFTPAGEPYGFRLTLPEDAPGEGNLPEQEALSVAIRTARDWGVDMGPFELVESSEETQPGGRIDHTFVFERFGVTIGDEGRFRLRLKVAGDRAAELTHYVLVPQAFSQRFGVMRSANDSIAVVAQGAFILLFVLAGAGIGTAVLLRQGWIVWRTPLAWGGVVALLFGLNAVNALPLAWIDYDTALSARTFVLEQIGGAALIAVLGTPLLAFFFMAAESLGRRAFPDHPQQWRFWAPEMASSNAALGRTVAAYLLLGFELGYVVLFYLGTSRLEGWWSPADQLVQPDLLATFQPWIQAVSTALFASMWEESVFRAVPIACAALLGARYGKKSLWIWGAVAVQAVVFAAGHANYPQQPAYARVAELSFPAFMWGTVYLYFGLVPTILTHFAYDLSLISIPLFASDAPGILLDRGAVILAGLVPLAVVVRARLSGRGTKKAPEWAYNRAWSPPAPKEEAAADAARASEARAAGTAVAPSAPSSVEGSGAAVAFGTPSGPSAGRPERPVGAGLPVPAGLLYALGAAGAVAWVAGLTLGGTGAPRLSYSRTGATEQARTAVLSIGGDVSGWRTLPTVPSGRGSDHRYVYEEAGEETYAEEAGEYLGAPRWIVRFVDFEAEPEERVEQYRVHVSAEGEVARFVHELPEARPGAELEEESARTAALSAVSAYLGLDAGSLEEIEASQTARPNRTDWEFTFRDPAVLSGVDGEARVTVQLAGEEVVDARRWINVPEEWERARREADTRRTLVLGGLGVLLVLGLVTADVLAVIAWSKSRLGTGPLLKVSAVVLAGLALAQLNAWPATTSIFTPEQTWRLQVGIGLFGIVLVVLVAAAAIGLAAGLGHEWIAGARRRPPKGAAVAVGCALVGIGAAGELIAGGMPNWPDYTGAVAFVPVLSPVLQGITPYVLMTTALLLLSGLAVRQRQGPLYVTVLYAAAVALGLVLVPAPLQQSIVTWVPLGLVGAGAVLALASLGAASPSMMPGVTATLAVTGLLGEALAGAYPGARVGSVLAAGVVVGLAVWWTRMLHDGEVGVAAG